MPIRVIAQMVSVRKYVRKDILKILMETVFRKTVWFVRLVRLIVVVQVFASISLIVLPIVEDVVTYVPMALNVNWDVVSVQELTR